MKLIRLLRTALALLRTGGTWADGEAWSAEDANRLSAFLHTGTGRKLTRRLRNSALALNAQAVQQADGWRNGQAAGYMLATADIQTLSARDALRDAPTTEEAAIGADGSLDHLAP
jgi:hypothetical protein